MQLFVKGLDGHNFAVVLPSSATVDDVAACVHARCGVPPVNQRLQCGGRMLSGGRSLSDSNLHSLDTVEVLLCLRGGIDFQNRHGSKPGSGGEASAQQAAINRRERLRQLALETVDLAKDPYFFQNHLGKYECKLCLTLHTNEGNYLAHTQGKRHQTNLARRAHQEKEQMARPVIRTEAVKVRKTIKIGRPGYKFVKHRDPVTGQRSLSFEVAYPEIEEGLQPRFRFMSAYEQKREAPDKNFQYILFAAEPYETIAFKVPNLEVDKAEGKFTTDWNRETKTYHMTVAFKAARAAPTVAAPPKPKLMYHGSNV